MATKLPYVNQPGSIIKVLTKIKEAQTPDRFTYDFLQTKLSCRGGPYNQFIPFAKKLGLLNSDGTPTDLYKAFRNEATSRTAVAAALRIGYRELFERNENVHQLSKEAFKGLAVEITGLDLKNKVVYLVCQTFESLKKLADFSASLPKDVTKSSEVESKETHGEDGEQDHHEPGLNLSYIINLVLPKTDDPAVFNAIFRSLRDNLLRK